jgi:hypothetical protein
MSFKRFVKLAGILAASLFLNIAEGRAQQPTIAEAAKTKSIQQPDSTSNTALQTEPPKALFLPNANHLTPLDEAYLDAFSILREDNTCSDFYGGPGAIEVLNQLKQQLKPTQLDSTVAVRMTGKATKVTSDRYLLSYRLFAQAKLNLSGPFYSGNALRIGRSVVPSIGKFPPNTREARVTILLHELGHLIERPDKQWVLPDDGASADLSEENTERVIAVCGKQIRSRSPISFGRVLQTARLVQKF